MRVAKELRKTKQELKDKKADTPNSKAKPLVEKLNLTREQSTNERKELVFANAICDEIRSAGHKAPVKAKKILQNL
ncbi:hypothetical protein ACF0H5_016044 [Mactra antiquata]